MEETLNLLETAFLVLSLGIWKVLNINKIFVEIENKTTTRKIIYPEILAYATNFLVA